MRQIVLDTETTGLEVGDGHRIIEIGCVELHNRRATGRTWHRYLQPDRQVDAGALAVHGITSDFLAAQPRFADVAAELIEFIRGAELVIHNAPFDVGFLDAELARLPAATTVTALCGVVDTLALARRMHPGQRNSLDALCRRYRVDASGRDLHGALLDARLLAEVYLTMTGGQAALGLEAEPAGGTAIGRRRRQARGKVAIPVIAPDAAELAAHEAVLAAIERKAGAPALFRRLLPDTGGS
ncbi:MAG: DNA polymerase III subunit epsilon [Gammaproteobacteria bacterium]|nr:MAG: DNA polymerase III subunit epsilon [Gammaproteobacteria bacterium]